MKRLRAQIAKLGPSNVPVLIQGPTGVGKELAAQGLHAASGRRGPCVAFNVCALPEGTLESALFGHVRGGFTGAITDTPGYLAQADEGTAFFDEISGLPQRLQPKLLRAIETRSFRPVGARADRVSDFRLVVATNDDLERLVALGEFRADLFYRLRGAIVQLPPLIEHPQDIPALARHFLANAAASIDGLELTDDALAVLSAHNWPGNVRQLRQVIEYAAVIVESTRLGHDEIMMALQGAVGPGGEAAMLDIGRHRLLSLLEQARWDTAMAARALGVHRATIYRRMERLGVRPPRRNGRLDSHFRANSHSRRANPANGASYPPSNSR